MSESQHATTAAAAPTPVAVAPSVDTAAVRELLGMMKVTLGNLDQTFRTLNEQSSQVSSLGPTMETAIGKLSDVRRQIRAQDKKQDSRVASIKRMLKEDVKVKAADKLGDHIRAQIRLEIEKQAQEQIALHITDVLPVPLADQVDDGRSYLAQVKHALANSEARRKNSSLKPSPNDLADDLAIVLRPNGERSALYPANLRSLFSYDYAKSKELVKDFDLHDHAVLEKNLNGFMAHIGIQFFLVPVPVSDAAKASRPVLMPVSAKSPT